MANKCVFCDIVEKNEQNILFQDNDLIVIEDIKPVAPLHYLIIPKRHIRNAKCLTWKDKPLIINMKDRGRTILEEKNYDARDTRIIFHWPPFQSINHLHLHVIAPANGMSFLHNISMYPGTWWCVTVDYVLDRISQDNRKDETDNCKTQMEIKETQDQRN